MIRTVTIDCRTIRDWETFHEAFQQAFGFPGWYGRNLNAWIDCMSGLDDAGMSDFITSPGEIVLLHLSHANDLKQVAPEILNATLEMAAFCNWRRIDAGQPPLLMVSCYA